MFHVKTVPALTRAGGDTALKRFLYSRRLRSTVTSTSATQPQEDDSSRGGARHDSARSERPKKPGRGGRDGPIAANEISVDFDQTREAYKSKDSLELLRSLVVFKLCSYDFLVDKNKEVMRRYPTVQPAINHEVYLLIGL